MTSSPRPREERLRALIDVSRAISASLAHEEILVQICSHAARLLDAESAVMTELCGPNDGCSSNCLKVVATSPQAQVGLGDHLSIEGSLNGLALTDRSTLIVNDVLADSRADHALATKLGTRQVVIAPLYYGGQALGTIFSFNSLEGRDFVEDDAEILEALAAQASIALHNARLFETAEKRLEKLTALQSVQDDTLQQLQSLIRAGMALNSRLSLDEVLQTLVDSAREVIKAQYAALGVLDRTATGLSHFRFSGLDQAVAERIGQLPTGGGTLGIMLQEARTLRIKDIEAHPAFAGFPEGHPSMRSLLGVPIRAAGRVFGNLYLADKIGADEFTEADQELAQLLGAQAAVAIENAYLDEQRSQFFAIVNHEIRNAAAGVVGWTDRLLKLTQNGEDRIHESAGYAFQGARELHRLVVDLLDLSRIEARSLALDIHETDLRALTREVVGSVRPTFERQNVELLVAGLDQRAVIETDRTRIRQILLNLLSNALKFSERGGRVDLELAPSDGGWSITVRDTGPGVDPAMGDKVFEAYKTDRPRTQKTGAGLGLAISQQLARVLGGELAYVDDGGPGATFTLLMPSKPSRLIGEIGQD